MKMEKKKIRIGELAESLSVERFVIRFWEKEFGLSSTRSEGGQRFYTEEDLAAFIRIKELLYNLGFTIQGAKKQLSLEKGNGAKLTTIDQPQKSGAHKTDWDHEQLATQIVNLKKQLKKLRNYYRLIAFHNL